MVAASLQQINCACQQTLSPCQPQAFERMQAGRRQASSNKKNYQ
jgi:hypothetical protein